jgi:RecA-family ATPase
MIGTSEAAAPMADSIIVEGDEARLHLGVVQPILRPNAELMLAHLDHLFGGFLDGYHEGLIELAWTDTRPNEGGKYSLRHARLFGTDQMHELIEEAVRLNSQPMCNVYIGAALRKPETAPFGRAADADAYVLTCAYVDLDDPGAALAAKDIYGKAKPTMIVVTGRDPHVRAQMWWRLEEPLADPAQWPALLKGMAAAMKGDSTVTNPARVMRLAGSVAWPVKEGRHRVEVTEIAPLRERGQSVYAYEHLAQLFPPVSTIAPAPQQAARATNSLGLPTGKITDGREAYMHRTIAACLVEYVGTTGAVPSVEELYELAWPQYERNVDFSRPGRGVEEFMQKCTYTLNRFQRGEIRGAETVDKAIEVYREKARSQASVAAPQAQQKAPEQAPDDNGPFNVSEFVGEAPKRQWLVKDWIPAGTVCSIYGDGGIGKTLIAQQMQYAGAVGGLWLGLQMPKVRSLGVYCEDERDEIHRRHDSITKMMGYTSNQFDLAMVWPRVGFDNLLVTFDQLQRPTMSPLFDRVMKVVIERKIELLILDTAADLFGGNEIVRNQVNFFVKAVCGAYARRAKELGWTLTVIILAHPSQAGRSSGTGESGSTGWSNAVRSRMYLTKPEEGLPDQRVLIRKKSNYAAAGDDEKIELMWLDGAIVPLESAEKAKDEVAVNSAIVQILKKVDAAFNAQHPYGGHKGYERFLPRKMKEELPHIQERIMALALSRLHTEQLVVAGKTSGKNKGYEVAEHAKVKYGLSAGRD